MVDGDLKFLFDGLLPGYIEASTPSAYKAVFKGGSHVTFPTPVVLSSDEDFSLKMTLSFDSSVGSEMYYVGSGGASGWETILATTSVPYNKWITNNTTHNLGNFNIMDAGIVELEYRMVSSTIEFYVNGDLKGSSVVASGKILTMNNFGNGWDNPSYTYGGEFLHLELETSAGVVIELTPEAGVFHESVTDTYILPTGAPVSFETLSGGDAKDFLRMDEGLETAILLSLFSDARALDGDEIPFGSDKRGFWGDALLGYSFGSKLWTLERSTITNKTLAVIESHMATALQWMLEDGVVSDVGVSATRSGNIVLMEVTIYRDGEEPLSTKYSLNWERMIQEKKGL